MKFTSLAVQKRKAKEGIEVDFLHVTMAYEFERDGGVSPRAFLEEEVQNRVF